MALRRQSHITLKYTMSLLHDVLRTTANVAQISAKLKDVNILDNPPTQRAATPSSEDGRSDDDELINVVSTFLHIMLYGAICPHECSRLRCQCRGLRDECPHVQCLDPHRQQDQVPHRVKLKALFTPFTSPPRRRDLKRILSVCSQLISSNGFSLCCLQRILQPHPGFL